MANEQNYTFKQQIECVEREISMRERLYPKWVNSGQLTQAKADSEIGCMKATLYTLKTLNRQYEEATK